MEQFEAKVAEVQLAARIPCRFWWNNFDQQLWPALSVSPQSFSSYRSLTDQDTSKACRHSLPGFY